jgi:5-methyltetrahydropteroyltriglutamate--homocysteine methyltransferase
MSIPTEPIGSLPRPAELLEGLEQFKTGRISKRKLDGLYERALRDTIKRFEATGSPVITDGEQSKPSFATYPFHGLPELLPDGVTITFADGHTRRLPRLTAGPFRYQIYADRYLQKARRIATVPLKQAVIAPSALSLLYPAQALADYPGATFLEDLVGEAEKDIRRCLAKGAHAVQLDFTEGRLAIKLDPSKSVLRSFVALNNRLLDRFSEADRARIGVHSCPGGDCDSTHSADVDYADLLPELFQIRAGNFYIQLASERDRRRVLQLVRAHAKPEQRIFVGVIDPLDPRLESAEQVCERVLEAAEFIEPARLGTTDDCGFAPFADDQSTARDLAFAKIAARVEGTALAAERLGL